jgi:hypothetical protein
LRLPSNSSFIEGRGKLRNNIKTITEAVRFAELDFRRPEDVVCGPPEPAKRSNSVQMSLNESRALCEHPAYGHQVRLRRGLMPRQRRVFREHGGPRALVYSPMSSLWHALESQPESGSWSSSPAKGRCLSGSERAVIIALDTDAATLIPLFEMRLTISSNSWPVLNQTSRPDCIQCGEYFP